MNFYIFLEVFYGALRIVPIFAKFTQRAEQFRRSAAPAKRGNFTQRDTRSPAENGRAAALSKRRRRVFGKSRTTGKKKEMREGQDPPLPNILYFHLYHSKFTAKQIQISILVKGALIRGIPFVINEIDFRKLTFFEYEKQIPFPAAFYPNTD